MSNTKFPFSPCPWSELTISCHFDKRYTNSCEVLSHSGFDLHSLMINDTEKLCVYLLSSWGKEWYLGTWPIWKLDYLVFFYWVVQVSYIILILTPYWICGCQYLLPFQSCLLILLMTYFSVQKLFSLIYFQLAYFCFGAFSFGAKSKISFPRTSKNLPIAIFF